MRANLNRIENTSLHSLTIDSYEQKRACFVATYILSILSRQCSESKNNTSYSRVHRLRSNAAHQLCFEPMAQFTVTSDHEERPKSPHNSIILNPPRCLASRETVCIIFPRPCTTETMAQAVRPSKRPMELNLWSFTRRKENRTNLQSPVLRLDSDCVMFTHHVNSSGFFRIRNSTSSRVCMTRDTERRRCQKPARQPLLTPGVIAVACLQCAVTGGNQNRTLAITAPMGFTS